MRPVRDFEKQLANLELEATVIANYVYAEMALHHAASKSRKLLVTLNRTPTLWRTIYAALQSSAYVALGRVFDLKSPYNIEALIVSMESDMTVFSHQALGTRKNFNSPVQLQRYLASSYVPTNDDIRRIRRAVQRRRLVYNRAIMPVRHQYLAHRQAEGATAQSLYAKGKVKEMWQLSCFLQHLYDQLWMLYHNGRKPKLRVTSRYSPKVMYDRPKNSSAPQERIVGDVRKLMTILLSAR
jgi:hypothetical protein